MIKSEPGVITFSENSHPTYTTPIHAITGASLLDQEMPAIETVVAQEVTVVDERRIPHILTVCQTFLMLFLVADEPKTMSLEFASKVIHGTDLKENYQKARTR